MDRGHLGDWFNAHKSSKPFADHNVMKWDLQLVDREVEVRFMSVIELMTTLECSVYLTDPLFNVFFPLNKCLSYIKKVC